MPDVFVSYRRTDSPGAAGRLCDHLSARFGSARVFRDVDSIEAGDDFEHVIHDALRRAAVVVIVIGPRWADARDAHGRWRLDDAGDYVRREIEIALQTEAVLLPVLVEGAVPLTADKLPEPLRPFARRQALELSDQRWNDDIRRVIERIAEVLGVDVASAPGVPVSGPKSCAATPPGRAAVAAVTGYPVNLASILLAPRRFLSRRSGREAGSSVGAFVFFVMSVVISDATLLGVYRPRDPVLLFLFSGLVLALLGTLAVSLPVWLAWRMAGARPHYARLLVVLFYQAGVTHLLVFLAITLGFLVVELQSLNTISRAIAAALEVEGSFGTAVSTLAETFESAVDPRAVLIATTVCLIGAAAVAVFLVRSWSAYADAFAVSRARSVIAGVLLLAMACLVPWLVLRAG